MNGEKCVERVKRTLVRAGSILDIYDDEMRLPDGSIEHWDFVSHRKGAACTVACILQEIFSLPLAVSVSVGKAIQAGS